MAKGFGVMRVGGTTLMLPKIAITLQESKESKDMLEHNTDKGREMLREH